MDAGAETKSADDLMVWSIEEAAFESMRYGQVMDTCYTTRPGVVISPGWMLATSERAEQRYKALSKRFPAGTVHMERNVMRELMQETMELGSRMEKEGVHQATFYGPFGPLLPRKGAEVVIKKGSVVYGFGTKSGSTELKRAQTVKVHHVTRGYMDMSAREDRGEQRVTQSQIHWAGAGGYWRWTEASNIKLD